MEVVWGLEDGVYPVLREVKSGQVVAIVSLGLSSDAKGFRIETAFSNWVNSKYCRPDESGNPVYVNRSAHEVIEPDRSRWDIGRMRWLLSKQGVPVEFGFSKNAGGFCCNAFAYKLCVSLQSIPNPPPFLFVHVPCTPECVSGIPDWDKSKLLIPQDQLERGFRAIVECLR
jgi:pyrrolidone-carboxylate peptidase